MVDRNSGMESGRALGKRAFRSLFFALVREFREKCSKRRLLGSRDDLCLKSRSQVTEVIAITRHAHDEVAVAFRMRLRLVQCFGRDYIELDVVAIQFEVRTNEVQEIVKTFRAFHHTRRELLIQ